jgi:hypothetical protein
MVVNRTIRSLLALDRLRFVNLLHVNQKEAPLRPANASPRSVLSAYPVYHYRLSMALPPALDSVPT